MVIHSTLTGADNHNPRMVSPDPLVIADNVTDVIVWEDTDTPANRYLSVSTTSGNRSISFGSTVTNPSYRFLGSGELEASTFTLPKLTVSPTTSTLEEKGKLYTKRVAIPSGPTVLELFYASDALTEIQLTSNGSVTGGGTLDDAYNFGGAAAGRQIDVDHDNPVYLNVTSGPVTGILGHALELRGALKFNTGAIVIGGNNAAVGSNSIVVGHSARANASGCVVIGRLAESTHSNGSTTVVGSHANSSHYFSIALGASTQTYANNQMSVGAAAGVGYVNELLVGGGDSNAGTVRTTTFRTSNSGVAANGRGWNLHVAAGRGMGSGAGGDIMLRTSAPGSSGLQSAFNAVGVDPTTNNASVNGEVLLASNMLTDPRRFSSFSGSVTSTNTATHKIVDLAGYSLGADQAGWLKVQLMVRSNNPSNSPQNRSSFFELATTFTLVSGALTLGNVEKSIPRIDVDAQTLTDADLTTTSSTELNVEWTATGSDDFDIVWSAEWLFGPIS